MSYRADKLRVDAHARTHTQTEVGNDNTRRPKLASGKNCTKGCLIFWSFKYFLDLVQKTCRAWRAQFQILNVFMAFNIFFKVKILWHLWRYCTNVISCLPMSLMMSRNEIILDFCSLDIRGFQQSFP